MHILTNLYTNRHHSSLGLQGQKCPSLVVKNIRSSGVDEFCFKGVNSSVLRKSVPQNDYLQVLQKIKGYEFGQELTDKIFQKYIALNIDNLLFK